MKKYLIALLLSLSCTFALAAVGCQGSDNSGNSGESSSESESSVDEVITDPRNITFENGEGYTFVHTVKNGVAQVNSNVTFSLEVGGLYTGVPLVYVNDAAIAANPDGSYTVEVTEDLTIRASGIRKDSSNMDGSGTMESPFVVTKPIDLVYIAEQVNKANRTYVTGSYILANDIDCKGAELQVIGNNPEANAYFSGCFVSNYDDTTGASYRYTISNFVINTQDTNYVGLFGSVFADLSVTSSGLFYGINLDNFTINAGMYKSENSSDTIACGSLIGYGVGANLYLCGATNGEINVTADDSYFSFAGGLIGYQQGYYFPEYSQSAASEIAYATVDVDVNILQGLGLYAGGISGYLATNYPFGAISSIHNSYATGSLSGAIRAGGIAGGLGQYTVVSNCYSTSNVVAISNLNNANALWKGSEYCYANAGGLVGFAENDSIVHDSAFGGIVDAFAVSGNTFATANTAIGGGYEQGTVSVDSQKYMVLNCLTADELDLSNIDCFTEKLGWGEYDWTFKVNEFPTINYSYDSTTITKQLELKYVTQTANGPTEVLVSGKSSKTGIFFNSASESASSYASLGNYFAAGGLDFYYEADNGMLSYGYFFDEACTQRVPYAYMPTKNVTLYIGFADPAPVVGTYYFTTKNGSKVLSIRFDADGTATYSDGASTNTATYSFDGRNILLEGARLARYYEGEIVVDKTNTTVYADENFDLYRYTYYNFAGTLKENGISLYDGVYFTADAPLAASKTEPTASVYDVFKGTWTKSATVNKAYTFDGKGNWTYAYTAYTRKLALVDNAYKYVSTATVKDSASGTYTVIDENTIRFTRNSVTYTATVNKDGLLEITDGSVAQVYSREAGYAGQWSGDGFVLSLGGIQANGKGIALITYDDGSSTDLVYEESETDGYVCLYLPDENNWKSDLLGYFSYDIGMNVLNAVFSDSSSETGYSLQSLYVLDDYNGEWISNASTFLNVEFHFNGSGLYEHVGELEYLTHPGVLTLIENGKETVVEYTLDSQLQGKFSYNGVEYTMTYDEFSQSITLTASDSSTVSSLERKDKFANTDFVDLAGNTYSFDGRSNLSTGGILTVNGETEYVYKPDGNAYTVYKADKAIGSLTETDDCYVLTVNGASTNLYISNKFMGEWAISGEFALFVIGPTDLNGTIQATFKGSSVSLTTLDPTTLSFRYVAPSGEPFNYYVFFIEDEQLGENVLALSSYSNLLGGYTVCSRANEMFGTWESENGYSIRFDGVSCSYQNGTAIISNNWTTTNYYYTVKKNGILMWSQSPLNSNTLYFRLNFMDAEDAPNAAYVKDDKAFTQTKVDGLCLTLAKDTATNEVYFFDGNCINGNYGGIWVGGENGTKKYEYSYIVYNADSTATLTVVDVATNKLYSATLNYADSANVTFTLGEEIVDSVE